MALYENQRGISFISPIGYHTSDRPNDAYVHDVRSEAIKTFEKKASLQKRKKTGNTLL